MANELNKPACMTCGGSGWIGGPSYYAPDEGGEECPDCALPPVAGEAVAGAIDARGQEADEATAMKGGRWVSADDIEHMAGELLSLATGDPYSPVKMVDAFHTLRAALASREQQVDKAANVQGPTVDKSVKLQGLASPDAGAGAVAAQPVAADQTCATCGATEPYTGTCGTSASDSKALCRRIAAAAEVTAPKYFPTVQVFRADAECYCAILRLLGMEEGGDPLEEVERLIALAASPSCERAPASAPEAPEQQGEYPQLLPCPFCGTPAELIDRPDGPLLVGAFAGCDHCGVHTPIKPFATDAIASWNLRAQAAPATGKVGAVAWAAVHFGGKRDGKIYNTCDTREQIDAYIQQVEQQSDSLTLTARPIAFADALATPAPTVQAETGEALKWCAAALQAVVASRGERGSISMVVSGEKKSLEEVLDMADAALKAAQPDQGGAHG